MTIEQKPLETHLWSTKGGSDKVYNAFLRPKAGAWVVDYTNGPRGGTPRPGTRTEQPLDYAAAHEIYTKLVKSKIKDGYTSAEGGQAYTSSEFAGRATGLDLQLLTAIDEPTCRNLLNDDIWAAQLKENGERRVVMVRSGSVTGANRNGLLVDIPQAWQKEYAQFWDIELDGEHVGDVFHAFDMLSCAGENLRSMPFAARYLRMTKVLSCMATAPPSLRLLEAQATSETKRRLLQHVRDNNLEGIVFKRLDSPYEAGRSKAALKFKLVDQATCIVVSHNVQRSVVVGLLDAGGRLKPLGNVTIPGNHEIPAVGQLAEIEFLYFTGNAFEQPVYLRQRTDLNREDARLDQVTRIKPANALALEPA